MKNKIILLLSFFITAKNYAQDIKSYQQRKIILENKIANLWQPNNDLDGNLSSEVFIPFFVNNKKEKIDEKNMENTLIQNNRLFVHRNISGKEVNFSVDDINLDDDININRE